MLQIATFWDIYIQLARLYTYIYIYKFYSEFFYNIFIEDAMPEKALKSALFKKIYT